MARIFEVHTGHDSQISPLSLGLGSVLFCIGQWIDINEGKYMMRT